MKPTLITLAIIGVLSLPSAPVVYERPIPAITIEAPCDAPYATVLPQEDAEPIIIFNCL